MSIQLDRTHITQLKQASISSEFTVKPTKQLDFDTVYGVVILVGIWTGFFIAFW